MPKSAYDADLHVDGVLESRGKQVVVVGGRGAAGEQQLGQGHLDGEFQALAESAGPRPGRGSAATGTAGRWPPDPRPA